MVSSWHSCTKLNMQVMCFCVSFYSDKHPSSATEVLIKMEERSRKLRSLAKEALQQFKVKFNVATIMLS